VNVSAWRTSIHVPRLVVYWLRYKGAQWRKPILSEEEVLDGEIKAMHGRGVTLSSIQPNLYSQYRKKQVSEAEEIAMSLVPSALRPKDEQTVEEEDETKEHETLLLSHPVTSTDSGRMHLNLTAPTPEPNRAEKREYVDAGSITRRWYYERAPPPIFAETEDDVDTLTRPPAFRITEVIDIDTVRTRRLELKRLLRTVRFLLVRASSKKLSACCERIEKVCANSLSSDYNETTLLQALVQIRNILIDDVERLQVWETVRPIRLGLVELLNHENRTVIGEALKKSPDILQLYGNNLFLLVLAVLDSVHGNALHIHVIPLWQSVVEWELYQMGFKPQQDTVTTKYDIHSLHSNLMTRARTLPTLDLPDHSLSPQQSGQIVWTEDDGSYATWIVFQYEKGLVAGLVQGLPSKWLRPSYFRCVTDPLVQRYTAEKALRSTDRNAIAVTEVGAHKLLWLQTEGEDENPMWAICVFEHGKPQREGRSVPWIRLREIHEFPELSGEVLAPPILPVDIDSPVDDFLREVADMEKDVIHVTCEVSINVDKEAYEVEFKDRSKGTRLGTLHFKNTSELVRTLRRPVSKGTPLRIGRRSLVMWDHQRDIKYSGCAVRRDGKREVISVSFLRPLVHRSRFHPDKFKYPVSCGELQGTTKGKRLTLVIKPLDSNKFNVELPEVSEYSSLKHLEGLRLDVFDMALLAACDQLIDTTGKTRHEVVLDARHISELRFSQIDNYPRLKGAVSRAETDWSLGMWTIVVSEPIDKPNMVHWKIRSLETGRVWKNSTFSFQLDYNKSLKEHVQLFNRTVSSVIPLKHITDFSETVTQFERTLQGKGLGERKVRCRLDLDVRDGKDVAVVSMIEHDGGKREIDSFPVDVGSLENLKELMIAGPLSYYDVVNLEEFYDGVRLAMSRESDESESDEEDADLITIIREYREEGDKRGLGHSLMLLARERLSEGKTGEAEVAVDEALSLLRECDPHNRLVRSDISGALVIKAETLIKEDRGLDLARELLQEARELVQSLLDTLRPGQTDVIVQKTGELIDRLLQQIDGS